MKKKKFEGIHDLQVVAIESLERMLTKKMTTTEVRTVVAVVNSVQSGLALRQEQARLSGTTVNGDVIMDIKLDPNAEPSMQKPKLLPKKAKKAA